jgi:uncharacterized protein (TIGR02145 family)
LLKFPSVTTTAISAITQSSAVSGGNATSDSSVPVTARGVCWTADNLYPTISNSKTTDGSGAGLFVSNLSGLTPGTYYNLRAYVTNAVGTTYGENVQFKTLGNAPECITQPATNISATGATLNGTVNANYISTIVTFEYGTTSGYGNSTTATQSPVTGNTITNVSSDIIGLTSGTTYHYRIKAVNSLGTIYSSDLIFTTTSSVTISDIDGNIYQTVTIGTQVWMVQNLKTTKYNDGTAIPNITDNTAWATLTTGSYSDYNNTPVNSTIYGRLYNWYAVDNNAATKVTSNGGKNVCPTSWHVATDAEWTTLTTNLGGESVAGGKLKETGTTHWLSPSTGATNETGFTALPGGMRNYDGIYYSIGYWADWWSSSVYDNISGWYRNMSDINVSTSYRQKQNGFSVRCLKD